jgi:hypothetical protein
MMARVGRLAGALLAETGGQYYLVGNTKEPCDFRALGIEPPAEIDALKHAFLPLRAAQAVPLGKTSLALELEGEALAERLAACFVIRRTGSVSERLWRLVAGAAEGDDEPPAGVVDARWLGEMPLSVWRVVQDTVLRCS